MKKYIYTLPAIILAISLVFLFGRSGSSDSSKHRKTLTIGIMMPLSGDFGAIGEGLGKAANIAISEYKTAHPDLDVRVVEEDDKFDTKTGIAAYSKMTTINHIDAMIMVSTPVLDAYHTQMQKDGIPIMSIGLQNDGVANDNIFQMTPDPNVAIAMLASYIQDKGNAQKLAIVHSNSLPASIAFYNTFTSVYKKNSVEFMINSVDEAKTIAAKIKNANVDGIVIMTMPGTGASLTKNLLELGVDPKKVTYYYDGQLSSGWSEYEKQLGSMNKIDNAKALQFTTSDLTAFKTKFKGAYNADPAVFSEYGYDGMKALLETYDSNKEVWIHNIQGVHENAYSGNLSFNDKGLRIQDVQIWTMSGGKLVK